MASFQCPSSWSCVHDHECVFSPQSCVHVLRRVWWLRALSVCMWMTHACAGGERCCLRGQVTVTAALPSPRENELLTVWFVHHPHSRQVPSTDQPLSARSSWLRIPKHLRGPADESCLSSQPPCRDKRRNCQRGKLCSEGQNWQVEVHGTCQAFKW